jgi:subfamily B ATP-binding cassette protein MsbA
VFDPVRKMGNVNNRLQQADVSARRLFELMDLKPEEPPAAAAAENLPAFRERIEFRNVCFAYPLHPERLVLDNVNLSVARGQCVALVGANGSGKTTLMSLLMRFHAPTRGEIRIDGRDIQSVGLDSLRGQIGLVTQDSVVFSDTVRANIAYGANGEATPENIVHAAQLAHVDDFIQTLRVRREGTVTEGYDAFVTARSLSGGQRQRIALARAILRDPPILILDEATSQIDSESERKIQEALEDVTRNRTTFIIAHRFSTIARADWIVVLDQGRVVAQGRHAELLKTSDYYVSFCQTQFAQAEME